MSRTAHLLAGLAALVLLVALATAAQAHRVKIFAYADAEYIYTESAFSKSSPAMGAEIVVTDATGAEVFAGKTDDVGHCDFPIPPNAKGDLEIMVVAGEGHQGSWTLTEAEYK